MTILELVSQTGINPKWVASTNGGEYHSPCPACGGVDRFYIQPQRQMSKCLGSYSCRQCGVYGDSIQFAMEFLNFSFQEAANAVDANVKENISFSAFKSFRMTTLKKIPIEWMQKANAFVDRSHQILFQKTEILKYLATRGLPRDAVIKYRLGWSNKDEFLSKASWGLSEFLDSNGKKRPLWIPKGLVIPIMELNGNVVRLKVRRPAWRDGDRLPKYAAISGSMNGLSIIGSSNQRVKIVVESELDAYAIDFMANDLACAIAIGSNIKNPDNVTDRLAENSSPLLICYDNDSAGKKMLIKWRELYPHAVGCPVPLGKDLGEAVQKGLNVRTWIQEVINSYGR